MQSRIKNTFLVISFLTLLGACGGGGTSSPTTTSSTTTITLDPIPAYFELQKSVSAISSSDIVSSASGNYVSIITDIPGSKNSNYMPGLYYPLTKRLLTLYLWKNNAWVDVSNTKTVVDPDDGANEITSRDFNGDGVKDFLVEFSGAEDGWGQILTNIAGKWMWAQFKYPPAAIIGDELTTGADGLYFDGASGNLLGQIVEDHTPLTWTWDKALGYFTAVAGERGF